MTAARVAGVAETPARLLLLDGHSLAYRAFFALPVENFSTSTGQSTNAVYGFTSMLINVLRDEQPTHLAVAFDRSRQTFRLAEYSEYKAGRNKTPTEFSSQLPLIRRLLETLRIPSLDLEGYEADDIATLATRASDEGHQVLIVSGDRDAMQLVTDTTTLIYPTRGGLETTDDAGRGRGEVRRAAGALQRPGRAGGGELGQPAGRARRGVGGTPPSGSTSSTGSTT